MRDVYDDRTSVETIDETRRNEVQHRSNTDT